MNTDSVEALIASGEKPSTWFRTVSLESQLSDPLSTSSYGKNDDERTDPSILDRKLNQLSITKINVDLFKRKDITNKNDLQEAKKIIKKIVRRKCRNNCSDFSSGPKVEKRQLTSDRQDFSSREPQKKIPRLDDRQLSSNEHDFSSGPSKKILSLESKQSSSNGQDFSEPPAKIPREESCQSTVDEQHAAPSHSVNKQPCTSDQTQTTLITDPNLQQNQIVDTVKPSSALASTSVEPVTAITEVPLKRKIKSLLKYDLKLYLVKTKQDSSFTQVFSDFVTNSSKEKFLGETEVRKSYILMFYRNVEIENKSQETSSTYYTPELFALTTGSAWQLLSLYADKEFTKSVERRTLAFTFKHVNYKYDSGRILKRTENARPGYEIIFDVWDFLGVIVGARKREPRKNSSLRSFHVSSKIHISERSMKIHRKMNVVELGNILQHFSKICSGKKTFLVNENKDEETDDTRFQMLDLVAKVTDQSILGELNESLHKVLKDCMNGVETHIFLTYPAVEKWQVADEICLYARKPSDQMESGVSQNRKKRKNIKTWDKPPSLDEVMQELHDFCGTYFQPVWLDDVMIKFSSTSAPLKKFILGRFSTPRIGTHIYNNGVWMEVKGEYLFYLEKDFVEKMKEHTLEANALPLLPWKHPGNKGENGYQVQKFDMNESKSRWKKHFEFICQAGQFDKVMVEAENLAMGSTDLSFDFQILKHKPLEQMTAHLYRLLECNLDEGDYNGAHMLLNMLNSPEVQIITCDKKTPHGIELCDILIAKGNKTYLVHVKAGFDGGPIRDVCSQIRNAADIIFREQQMSRGTDIISDYWKVLTKPAIKPETHENEVKGCLENMTEEKFKNLFCNSKEITFVLACCDTRKGINFSEDGSQIHDLEAKVTDEIRRKLKMNQSTRIIAKLTKEDYLTEEGCLTNKFILEGKNKKINFIEKMKTWNEIGSQKMATDVFHILASGLSRSKSTIAKLEISRLVKDFQRYRIEDKKFQLKIYSIGSDFADM